MKTISRHASSFLLNCDLMKNISPSLLAGSYRTSYFGSFCTLFLMIASIMTLLVFMSI